MPQMLHLGNSHKKLIRPAARARAFHAIHSTPYCVLHTRTPLLAWRSPISLTLHQFLLPASKFRRQGTPTIHQLACTRSVFLTATSDTRDV